MFTETITRLRAQRRTNRGGESVPDWTQPPSSLVIPNVSVQPSSTSETMTVQSSLRASRFRVYSEPGAMPDVEALDRVSYGGNTYEVEGDVSRWTDPMDGGWHHIEFVITREEGG